MAELIVAILGAAAGIIILRLFDKRSVDSNQKKLEAEVAEKEKEVAGLEGEQKQEDKETAKKVEEIEKEQSKDLSGDSLADFFRDRK